MMSKQIVSFRSFIDEMQSVVQARKASAPRKDRVVYASQAARTFTQKIQNTDAGSAKAGSGQAVLNITSLAGVTRLISRDNQQLLQIIAAGEVTSLADLAGKANRAESNLSRTLKKLEAVGVLELVPGLGRAKIPRLSVESFRVEIDVVTGQVQMVSARKTPSRPALAHAPLTQRHDRQVKSGKRAVVSA
jgi:predicted transcriptional regulator